MLIWEYAALVAELFRPVGTHYKFNLAMLKSGTFQKEHKTTVMVFSFILESAILILFFISLDLLRLWHNG